MKKIYIGILLTLTLGLMGCDFNASNPISPSKGEDVKPDSSDAESENKNDFYRPNNTALTYTDYGSEVIDEMPNYDKEKWYRNDLKDIPLPDPYVYVEDGTYYIYGTTDRTAARSFDCYSTTDFITYKQHRDFYKPPKESNWEGAQIFAPELYKIGEDYYLYYSNMRKDSNIRDLTVVKGKSPIGPFNQINERNADGVMINGLDRPVFDINTKLGLSSLDQTLFIENGEIYTYFVVSERTQHIRGAKMKNPITIDWDTEKKIVVPGELDSKTQLGLLSWEKFNSYNISEAPFLLKSPNGKYYMTYSVNDFKNKYYSICYAEGDSPLGNFKKPYTKENRENGDLWTNLLLGYSGNKEGTIFDKWTGFASGCGHHSFFNIGDDLMICYHAHANRRDIQGGRRIALDRVLFDDDGRPYTDGPSYSIKPRPEALSGYKNIALTSKVKALNVSNEAMLNDDYIVRYSNLRGEDLKEATINSGKAYIEFIFDREYEIGGINIVNSAYYNKAIYDIDFINFFNDNVIYNSVFMPNYYNDDKEFIFPNSGFTIDFDSFKATKVVIGFNLGNIGALNEIQILGR